MIELHYETDFKVDDEIKFSDWISRIIDSEDKLTGDINYIFCTDSYLLNLNQKYLSHDTLTDIITFDYSEGNILSGDIYISIERVRENSNLFNVDFFEEVLRVTAHGVLHLAGYKDKSDAEASEMRNKEDDKIEMFHVEH